MSIDTNAELLKALGEPTRLRCAALLAGKGEICVCDLAQALGEPDFKISRHLSVLRKLRFVSTRREGTWMHYSLSPSETPFTNDLHQTLKGLLAHDPDLKAKLAALTSTSCS